MKNISVFCDFDATISLIDVCDKMFENFSDFDKFWQEFAAGKYNIRELNKKLCNSLPKNLTFEEIKNFALTQEIDKYFATFVEFCNKNNFNLHIVSDGYDVYIYPILEKYNLIEKINKNKIFCNSLKKNELGFYPDFFGAVESCNCQTSSCKRNVILNNSADENIIVYVGDGHTDFCCAEYSDIVFAKSKLAAFCNENRIPHHNYKSFFDVIRTLENSIKAKKIKKRNHVFMKRKNAFEAE
jgi:2,3-diketo-5-methylthio-1-phosphopentane phosphatase